MGASPGDSTRAAGSHQPRLDPVLDGLGSVYHDAFGQRTNVDKADEGIALTGLPELRVGFEDEMAKEGRVVVRDSGYLATRSEKAGNAPTYAANGEAV